jgi:hypothetical protein
VVLTGVVVVLVARWWWQMEHVLHLANASSTQAHTIRVVLDNQPMVSHDVRLEPEATDTIRFSARTESGYVFFVVDGGSQFELGRCGHTDKRTNEYRVRLAPGQPFACTELSTDGPWPF